MVVEVQSGQLTSADRLLSAAAFGRLELLVSTGRGCQGLARVNAVEVL